MNGKEKRQAYRKTISYWIYAIGGIAIVFGIFFIQNKRKRGVVDIIILLGYICASHVGDFTKRRKQIEIGFYVLVLLMVIVFEFFVDC